jgi:hypothetical protein
MVLPTLIPHQALEAQPVPCALSNCWYSASVKPSKEDLWQSRNAWLVGKPARFESVPYASLGLELIQCTKCGGVVGVTDQALAQKLEKLFKALPQLKL